MFNTIKEYKNYWDKRAKEQGKNVVTHAAYLKQGVNDKAINNITLAWLKLFDPLLTDIEGKTVLDYGCGHGRFTPHFVELGASKVYGLDMTKSLIKIAKDNNIYPDVIIYKQTNGKNIELEKDSVDVIFTCTVLQHIVIEEVLKGVILEFKRVLKKGGMVVLMEGCETNAGCPHVYHRTYEEWSALFPFIKMTKITEYCELVNTPTHVLMKGIYG